MAHILLVEDDPTLRRGIARLLGRQGHQVSEAGTGVEAMNLVEKSSFDAVVTDINMPEMDGMEVIMKLRKLGVTTPIIAMSGGGRLPGELLLENALMLGAVATVSKPFEPAELLDTIARLLADASARTAPLDEG